MSLFTNREIAFASWTLLFLLISLLNKNIRISILKIIKSIFKIKIALYVITSTMYFTLVMILSCKLLSLDASQIKDSIIWFLVSGIFLTASSFSSRSRESIISRHILENIKLTVFTEYIVATYVFSLSIELISLPIIAILALMQEIAKKDVKLKPIEKVLDTLLVLIGLYVLSFSVYSAIVDYKTLIGFSSTASFIMPFILMIVYFPFSYSWILYAKYEELYTAIKQVYNNLGKNDLGIKIRKAIFKHCKLNYNKLINIRNNEYYFWHFIKEEKQIEEFLYYNKSKIKKVYEDSDS